MALKTSKNVRRPSSRLRTSLRTVTSPKKPPAYGGGGSLHGGGGTYTPTYTTHARPYFHGENLGAFTDPSLTSAWEFAAGRGNLPLQVTEPEHRYAIDKSSIASREFHNAPYAWDEPTESWFLTAPYDEGGYGYGDGGGGGGGEIEESTSVKWLFNTFEGANPQGFDWWKSATPEQSSDMERADVQFSAMLNAMIPYMAPEDAERAARQMYEIWDTQFSHYKADQFSEAGNAPLDENLLRIYGGEPGAISSGRGVDEDWFQSASRAQQAIQTLSNMRDVTVGGDREKLGPGYKWLQNLLGAIENTQGGRSRGDYLAMMGQVDPMLNAAKSGDLGAYGPIGQMLAQPFFSQFMLHPTSTTPFGTTQPGRQRPWWM